MKSILPVILKFKDCLAIIIYADLEWIFNKIKRIKNIEKHITIWFYLEL